MAYVRTSLGLCNTCIDNPHVDGGCACATDLKVCDICRRGPLNDSDPDVCGERDCTPAPLPVADKASPQRPDTPNRYNLERSTDVV